jgi:hypothetical protein
MVTTPTGKIIPLYLNRTVIKDNNNNNNNNNNINNHHFKQRSKMAQVLSTKTVRALLSRMTRAKFDQTLENDSIEAMINFIKYTLQFDVVILTTTTTIEKIKGKKTIIITTDA